MGAEVCGSLRVEDLKVVFGFFGIVESGWADFAVVGSGVVFGVIIGHVGFTATPDNFELALSNSAFDPVEAHVDGFGSFLFDGVVGNAEGSAVVGDNDSWWLWMAKFFQADAFGARVFGIEECSSELSFGCGRDNVFEDLAGDMNGTVGARWFVRGEFSKEMVAGPTGLGFWLAEVGTIAFNGEDHVGGTKNDFGLGIGGSII